MPQVRIDMAYKIIFFGTSDFSLPSLEALINDARFDIAAVVTKPDAPVGRHQTITPPPIKTLAIKHGIKVLQFDKIKTDETYEALANISQVDAYVVVSYGKIIPQRILDLPKQGVINVHGSLLPRWRGASCVQAAIAAGDEKTGVTFMKMDAELDHGDIISQNETGIGENETGGQLHDRLAELGAANLPDVLSDYLIGNTTIKAQDHEKATFCRTLKREDGQIDWKKSASEIELLVRAYEPWPGTFTTTNNKRLKIHRTSKPKIIQSSGETGAISKQGDALVVKCGDGHFLELLEVQPEGKRIMSSTEFLAGWRE